MVQKNEKTNRGVSRTARRMCKRHRSRLLCCLLTVTYLELVLHIHIGLEPKYAVIYLLFSLSAGCLLTAIINLLPLRAERVAAPILTGLLGIVYSAELVCRSILQSYYPLSSLGTAAENHLSDYIAVVFSAIGDKFFILLLFFLPLVVTLIPGPQLKSRFATWKKSRRPSRSFLIAAVVLHLLGLGAVHLPWNSDLPPKQLYHMDSSLDAQVEQLGLVTMLRLDFQHQLFPVHIENEGNFEKADSGSPAPSAPPAPEASPVPAPEQPPEIDRSPNVMDVNLSAIASNAKNNSTRWLAEYFNSLKGTRKNEYTGMFKGYNVIEVVVEGLSGYAIDPELTPTLYKLTHEGFYCKNFYTALHYTSTSNGECQTLLGLYPKSGNPITMKRTGELGTNCYFSLSQQLLRQNYQVQGYHANSNMYGRYKSHTNLGFNWKQGGSGFPLEMKNGKALWPQRDTYMIEQSIDDFIHSDQPFYTYYLTISGHMPYSDNRIVAPYREIVRQLPYSKTTQNYVATAMELDRALELLIRKLDEAGKLENTLLVVTPDHIPYSNVDVLQELSGQKFAKNLNDLSYLRENDIDFEVYHSALILWSASMKKPVEVDKVCCQVDILPTVSNLLGLEYDSRMLAGSDILSDSEGLVVFSSRCWKSDRGFYNSFTRKFTPATGVAMTPEEQNTYVSAMQKLVGYKLDSTSKIVENNFYNIAFGSSK